MGMFGLPGKMDILFAMGIAVVVVFLTAVMTRLFPGLVFTELFAATTSLFLIIVSLSAIFGFIAFQEFWNLLIGPLWALLLNNVVSPLLHWVMTALVGGANFFTLQQIGFQRPTQYVFELKPTNLLPVAEFFARFFIDITGVTNTTSGELLLGGALTGAGSGILGGLGSGSTDG